MSGVHFHLIFTHGLVSLVVIGVLVLAWSLLRRNYDIRMTGLGLLVAAGLLAIPVYLTGESAEESVEDIAGVTNEIIHVHEESAELTFIGVEILGAAALVALLIGVRRKSVGAGIAGVVLVLGLVVSGLIVRTAELGGEIRHSEIRSASSSPNSTSGGGEYSGKHEEEEDSH